MRHTRCTVRRGHQDRYQFSNYDCAGNLGGWAANATYRCFGEVYLRVLSDSDSALVAGAAVTTAYDFAYTCVSELVPSCPYLSCFSGEAFKSFTTSTSTEWYAFGDAANSFSVIYGGQAYNVTASQRAGSTCVTLHVPSGAVDTTYGASCATAPGSSASTLCPVINNEHIYDSELPCLGRCTAEHGAESGSERDRLHEGGHGPGHCRNEWNALRDPVRKSDDGNFGLTNHYCISMRDVNGTGYLQLAPVNFNGTRGEHDFISSGYYNVTLVAGHEATNNQGLLGRYPFDSGQSQLDHLCHGLSPVR